MGDIREIVEGRDRTDKRRLELGLLADNRNGAISAEKGHSVGIGSLLAHSR